MIYATIKEIVETKYEAHGMTFDTRHEAELYSKYMTMLDGKTNTQLEDILISITGGSPRLTRGCEWDNDTLKSIVAGELKRLNNVFKKYKICI